MAQTRRSPIRHDVDGYTRKDGTKVPGYPRGHGTRSRKAKRSRVVGKSTDDDTPIGVHAFTVNFKYSNRKNDGESVIVISNNYVDALDEAWEERVDTRMPIAVEAIDPDIGAAISWMGKRVKSAITYGAPKIKKAAHLGAKYTIKATMVAKDTGVRVARAGIRGGVGVSKAGWSGAKELRRLTAFGIQAGVIENLLKLCYQKDRAKRTAARVALKRRYPEVYDMCDFSRETSIRSRKISPKVVSFPRRLKRQRRP